MELGFWDIKFHKPIVSNEGREALGEEFWEDYQDNSELLYITAEK